jgi:hypothetical protein
MVMITKKTTLKQLTAKGFFDGKSFILFCSKSFVHAISTGVKLTVGLISSSVDRIVIIIIKC